MEEQQDTTTGVIFFMTYRTSDGLEGHRMRYSQDKPTTKDYFKWLCEKIKDIRKELDTKTMITSHSVTGELNQK